MAQNQQINNQAPDKLPADFAQWDSAPATLPPDFAGFDAPSAAPVSVNSGISSRMALHVPNQPATPKTSDDFTDALQNSTISPAQSGITGAIDRFRGKLRTFMGADSKPAADVLGGVALGPVNVAHGLAVTPSHPLRGANEVVRGIGQTVALPMAVTNPEFMATAAPYSAASSLFQSGAQQAGIDPDLAEFMGNVAMAAPAARSIFKRTPELPTFHQKALPNGPIITPPPADSSGSIPFTPPPFSNTTRAQRLGLMLPEKASGAIQLGPGEILPPSSPEGLFPAAPHFLVDGDGNPRVQFLTSAATDQVAAPNTAPDSAQSLFQNTPAKSGLLDGIRDHEFMSGVQDSMNGQAGDYQGQSFLDKWMESHNQQAPGAKTGPGLMKGKSDAVLTDAIEKANASGQSVLPPEEPQAGPGLMNKTRKAKAQPQVATADNVEDLLRQSLLNRGVNPDAAQGGHAGGGVSSVEELNRPGTNYVVSKSGQLTYHGKSFAPESTPDGASHVTALPDGTYRVNAGPELNVAQTKALKAARPDIGLPLHSGPHPVDADQAEINRLAQEVINAKNKKSGR